MIFYPVKFLPDLGENMAWYIIIPYKLRPKVYIKSDPPPRANFLPNLTK
jgi:hypothetical protein